MNHFDIFGLSSKLDINGLKQGMSIENIFVMIAIAVVVGIIILTLVFLNISSFKLSMSLSYILVTIYIVFFVLSMAIGLLSRED